MKELTLNDFDAQIGLDTPTVVEFYTPTCAHCKRLSAAIDSISGELGDTVTFAKVDIAQQTALQGRYDVTAVPTVLFIRNGEIKNRLVGEIHPLILQEEIKKLK